MTTEHVPSRGPRTGLARLIAGLGPVMRSRRVDGPARRHWFAAGSRRARAGSSSAARKVLAVGVLVIVLLVATTAGIAFRRYESELTDAARALRTVDLLLAEEAGRSLQSVALVLDNVADQVRAEAVATPESFVDYASTKAVHDALRARVAGVPQLDAVTLVGARGKLVNFSRAWPIPDLDLSDRDYFAVLRDTRTDTPFLSEPAVSRVSGTPTVYLARRLSAPDGRFLGLVIGAVVLSYFEKLYASLHLQPGDFIALWRQDGVLLARYPPATLGQHMPPEAITAAGAPWEGVEGVFEKVWTIDKGAPQWRVVASQAVDGFPVQVNFGRGKAVILADWRREVTMVVVVVAFSVACLGVLMWALVRRLHAYEAVAVASREREAAILARREAEDALRQAQKMDAVGQLTGGVAHDFNNLLTVMRGSVDLLRRPHLTEERRSRYIDAIADATDRAAKLTGQLLAFARRQALKPEVFDAVGNVVAVCELIERLAGSRVRVEGRLPDGPCCVEADPSQFDTSIVNMALNGRDAMPDGGRLTIAVEARDGIPGAPVAGAPAGGFVAVSVSDTGTGIPPEMLDRVFEPFFTTKKVGEGTGLGLSQVFGFAKQSGGEVLVESRPGRGSTFTLYLPRVPSEGARPKPPAAAAPSVLGGRGIRVLVVEDDEQVARAALLTLSESGYDPTWAPSGEQALVALSADPSRFHLVFSDVMMPGMSGIELARVVRRSFGGLPIVLTSGYSPALAQPGAHDFPLLRKPYAAEDLYAALREALAAAPGHRAAPAG